MVTVRPQIASTDTVATVLDKMTADPKLQLKQPSVRADGKSVYMRTPASLEEATRPNLDKPAAEFFAQGTLGQTFLRFCFLIGRSNINILFDCSDSHRPDASASTMFETHHRQCGVRVLHANSRSLSAPVHKQSINTSTDRKILFIFVTLLFTNYAHIHLCTITFA